MDQIEIKDIVIGKELWKNKSIDTILIYKISKKMFAF